MIYKMINYYKFYFKLKLFISLPGGFWVNAETSLIILFTTAGDKFSIDYNIL